MKTSTLTVLLIHISSTYAFTKYSSSFTGSAQSVATREELTTKLSCPPSRSSSLGRRGTMLSMPPFLKKLGLKKPEKNTIWWRQERRNNSHEGTILYGTS